MGGRGGAAGGAGAAVNGSIVERMGLAGIDGEALRALRVAAGELPPPEKVLPRLPRRAFPPPKPTRKLRDGYEWTLCSVCSHYAADESRSDWCCSRACFAHNSWFPRWTRGEWWEAPHLQPPTADEIIGASA